jgi:phenylalanyl-tRNA synthetase beta chain
MKASHKWLRELVPALPNDPAIIKQTLTNAGLEVEGVHHFGAASASCIVVRVESFRPHPSRSGLRLVTVFDGSGTREIVCGAPNVPEPGGLVVLAPLGTVLPAIGLTIAPRAIGGVTSEGMLCSEKELGLSEEGEGILVFAPEFAAPGTRLADAGPSFEDWVYELSVTPNRPDALGHVGLARELCALLAIPFALAARYGAAPTTGGTEAIAVELTAADRCDHYAYALLSGAHNGPSPLDLRLRLQALGSRSISRLVDVTNEALLLFGHPVHAFDRKKIAGDRIEVRRAKAGESIVCLDGVSRTLVEDDLVIADAAAAVAIAGVMGGQGSSVDGATTEVVLEVAAFDPRSVRRTGRRHAMHTDASHRFERGIDASDTDAVRAWCIDRMRALTGAALVGHGREGKGETEPNQVTLRHERVELLTGAPVPWKEAQEILARLGFERLSGDSASALFAVPHHRPDCSREEDLIEEVMRVRGFDAIPAELPAIRPAREVDGRERFFRALREAAAGASLHEACCYALLSPEKLAAAKAPAAHVVLQNPLHSERSVLRTSLLPGLLDNVALARRKGERDARIFTVGRVFLPGDGAMPAEPMRFCAVLAGERAAWLTKSEPLTVWDALGLAEGVVDRALGLRVGAKPATHEALHPRASGDLFVGEVCVGRFGQLHPRVADAFEVGRETLVVEFDVEALYALPARSEAIAPLPRFPANYRDVALVVPEAVAAGTLVEAIRVAAGDLAKDVVLFDRYRGAHIPEGHASLAFRVLYRHDERSLTDAEVDERHGAVLATVHERFGVAQRA